MRARSPPPARTSSSSAGGPPRAAGAPPPPPGGAHGVRPPRARRPPRAARRRRGRPRQPAGPVLRDLGPRRLRLRRRPPGPVPGGLGHQRSPRVRHHGAPLPRRPRLRALSARRAAGARPAPSAPDPPASGPIPLEIRGNPALVAAARPALRELAFLFRHIPVKERQLGLAGRPLLSGVRFPQYPGKRTPVALGRSDMPDGGFPLTPRVRP